MKKIFLLVFTMAFILTVVNCNNHNNDYRTAVKEKLNVELSIPENAIKTSKSTPHMEFTFGNISEELPTAPVFESGITVCLSNGCTVVMEDVENIKQPCSGKRYERPVATGWMLNNCDTPWAEWYINNAGGVITEENKILSDEEQTVLEERIIALRTQHERCIVGGELTQKSNCDRIFIVKIPYMEKINVNKLYSENSGIELEAEIKDGATECYGVEFHKQPNRGLKMLFFIDSKQTTIDGSVDQMAEYITFE